MKLRSNINLATMVASAGLLAAGMTSANATLFLTTTGPDGPGIANAYKIDENGSVKLAQIVTALNTISPSLGVTLATLPPVIYKAEPGQLDSGTLAGSYSATWSPATKPESVAITGVVGQPAFDTTQLTWFLAKDGVSHYVWNLTGIWDGSEPIEINNLWPDQGNFSHIEIGGTRSTTTTVVPEPSTYVAGGLALLPLLFGLRSRLAKKA